MQIEPIQGSEQPCELICFSDSDYAGDPDSRRSIYGFVLYIHGVPIIWRSKGQHSVALSCSEAEWIAVSEAVKEVVFVLQLLQSMKIKVKLLTIVCVDNVGAIFMTKNITNTGHSKHIDIHYKFVKEYIEHGIIKVIFVKLADSDKDIMTKILDQMQSKHADKMISMKEIL